MKFISTRGKDQVQCGAQAIAKGLASDGGLFVPETFPNVYAKIEQLLEMDYAERASEVIGSFLTEYDREKLLNACKKAYNRFTDNDPAPLVRVDDDLYILELFNGPTFAFKDVALTLLPFLLREGAFISGIKEQILILVATSGDTGKAALSGFQDAEGIKIMVFFPSEGVSDMQKLQMCTQEGNNVNVVAVKGNFDDCQTAVKKIFSNKEYNQELKDKGVVLSSANSINFGRLVPQITYYFSAYCDMVNAGEIKMGEKINFTVPTGNFGNILAGYYAKKMGLPINKLICASNSNNVLTEFFANGTYDANREFYKTTSPSMDILVSSNLERLIFELYDRDAVKTANKMEDLKKQGKYEIDQAQLEKLESEFFADFADEEEVVFTTADFFDEYGYVLDPHTAVAINVNEKYKSYNEDELKNVVLSTASPYKFPQSVLKAIANKKVGDAFDASVKLENETGMPIPEGIRLLKNKQKRFNKTIERTQTLQAVDEFIK